MSNNLITLPTSDIAVFKQQLMQPNIGQKLSETLPSLQKLQKNLVIASSSDRAGCAFYRVSQPLNYINNLFSKEGNLEVILSNPIIFQHNILMKTKSFFLQRLMSGPHLQEIRQLKELQKKYGYKLIYELDDFIFSGSDIGECIPEYNNGGETITEAVRNCCIESIKLCDLVTSPSEFLLSYITNNLKINVPTFYLPNCAAQYSWGNQRKKPITEKIKIPKILVASSPCHYSNQKKLAGDFQGAWKEYLIRGVRENKISLTIMGGCPWFLENLRDRITVLEWVNSYQYSSAVLKCKTDFMVAPLQENFFNASKSDIKMVEASASGNLFVGSSFTNPKLPSPYQSCPVTIPHNCSVSDIENIIDHYSEPEEYNRILKIQYEWMRTEGRYLESAKNIQRWTSIL